MKMIKCYAIEPTALRRWQDFRYVMEKLSFSEGRVLVALPKKWIRQLLESLEVNDIERERFVTRLQRYKEDRMVPSGFPYDTSLRWIDNARVLEGAEAVDAILVSEDTSHQDESLGYPTPAEIDESFFSAVREIRVLSTPENLCSPAKVLLQWSAEALFVDPYFKVTTKGNLSVLSEFARHAGLGSRCQSFMIFTKSDFMPKGGEALMRDAFDVHLGSFTPSGFKVTVHFIDTESPSINFHARYFLTSKGGLRYDKGFATRNPAELVDISLLDQRLQAELIEVFTPENSELGIGETWIWVASGTGRTATVP